MDLLIDELVLCGLSPSGEMEKLRSRLLQEVELEDKLRRNLQRLNHVIN
jgi:hypothetical protein